MAFTCTYTGGGRVTEKTEHRVEEVILLVQHELCVSRDIFLPVANTQNVFISSTSTRAIVIATEENSI